MQRPPLRRGSLACRLRRGAYAWLAPDGSWGRSNAGLVVDRDESMVVDTLFDLPLTATMLAAMRDAEPTATRHVDRLVNTHANGDHCHGNELVGAGEIIASAAAAREMEELPPAALAGLVDALGSTDTALGRYVQHCFGSFELHGITPAPPTRTFDGQLTVAVGDKQCHLIQVGPAHTAGDVLIHVPDDGVVFTGDILFVEGTPIVWAGPIGNWIEACELILGLGVHVIVPGHGPITDDRGPRAVCDYLSFVEAEATERYHGGMSVADAAADIDLGPFEGWSDSERIVVNVASVYRQLSQGEIALDVAEQFAAMADHWTTTAP